LTRSASLELQPDELRLNANPVLVGWGLLRSSAARAGLMKPKSCDTPAHLLTRSVLNADADLLSL